MLILHFVFFWSTEQGGKEYSDPTSKVSAKMLLMRHILSVSETHSVGEGHF